MKQNVFTFKRTISLLLSLILLLGICPVSALAATNPTLSGDTYLVKTAAELAWVAEQVNSGTNTGIKVKLTEDITLDASWSGIGTEAHKFAGSFDGNGKTIKFSGGKNGLFNYVMGARDALVTISDLTTAGNVNQTPIAAKAGYATFTLCVNKATVNANSINVGGIVGEVIYETIAGVVYTSVRITQCGNEGSITSTCSNVGGILGVTTCGTFLSQCYNSGTIEGNTCTGGLVGSMQNSNGGGSVTYSYNSGMVSGKYPTAGIIGDMSNNVTISHCYNSGETEYAFAARRYNHTSAYGDGCYYLGVNSKRCSPDATESMRYDANSYEISTRATAKSAAEMATEDFARALGIDYFQQSCPTPVLNWQTPRHHTGDESCDNCPFGSTEKEEYTVTYQTHEYFTLEGPAKVTQGESLTVKFALKDAENYKTNSIFAVKANGVPMTATGDGNYVTKDEVSGPLSITVTGVQKSKKVYDIKWSDVGNGYRIQGEPNVQANGTYKFQLSFEDGFMPAENLYKVEAHEIVDEALLKQGAVPEVKTLTEGDNGYVIPRVNTDYRIVVSGLGTDPAKNNKVTVKLRVSEGYYEFHRSDNPAETMWDIDLEVPYFDLGLYDLGKYYYNPNCYIGTDGKPNARQQVGTPESAYNNVTIMHAFIVATERFRMNYSQNEVGKALHRTTKQQYINAFNTVDREATKVSWSQDVGSSFMNFWTHGTNLNYYLNYVYPLAYTNWGSTSDQILIKDGDDITIHLIKGSGSGSRFGVFTVNDRYKEFDQNTTRDEYTVQQGQKVNLTLYWTGNGPLYSTRYDLVPGSEIYWTNAASADADIRNWNKTPFGVVQEKTDGEEEEEERIVYKPQVTDKTGTVTIDTTGVAPGTYYIAAPGAYSETGAMNAKDESSGAEAGAAFFKLTVRKSTTNGLLGDVNRSGTITADDATMVLRAVVDLEDNIDLAIADVNGSGTITADDATMILRYVVDLIPSFPAENKK